MVEAKNPNISVWRNRQQLLGMVGNVNNKGELFFPRRPTKTEIVNLNKISGNENGSGNGQNKENPLGIPIYQASIKEPVPA